MVTYRGHYFCELDLVHGDRRTRVEVFQAIERVAEQLLVRLDPANSVLGYIDPENGRYVLNTQRNIAEDAGTVSSPVLCRLSKTLEAGYVYRRIERIRLDEKDEPRPAPGAYSCTDPLYQAVLGRSGPALCL